jgi:hypothetical protein
LVVVLASLVLVGSSSEAPAGSPVVALSIDEELFLTDGYPPTP